MTMENTAYRCSGSIYIEHMNTYSTVVHYLKINELFVYSVLETWSRLWFNHPRSLNEEMGDNSSRTTVCWGGWDSGYTMIQLDTIVPRFALTAEHDTSCYTDDRYVVIWSTYVWDLSDTICSSGLTMVVVLPRTVTYSFNLISDEINDEMLPN